MKTRSPRTSRPADFCSSREAAKLLGVSIKTVQLWTESKALKAWKTPGGHRRILRSSVTVLLKQRDQAANRHRGAPAKRFTLLIVEDEVAVRRLYELVIADWGLPLRVITARDGFEGLFRIVEEQPEVLLTDLSMPGMDGLRMIKALREKPETQAIHVIVASGMTEAEVQDRGGLPPEVDFFSKPVAFDRLRLLVEKLLVGN